MEFLESTRVGCRASAEAARARVDEDRDEGFVWGFRQRGGRAGPALIVPLSFHLSRFLISFVGFRD